jgi:hypothetical protein
MYIYEAAGGNFVVTATEMRSRNLTVVILALEVYTRLKGAINKQGLMNKPSNVYSLLPGTIK